MIGILDGIRVVEWGHFHAGPGGTALLGDMGAEIIKIEERIVGDAERNVSRLGTFSMALPGGRSVIFEASSRNKKSITLDIRKPEAKEIAYRLIEQADVFLTNHRQRAVVKQGFDYETLRQRNPRLIYCRVSAFGRNGPDADLGGYDFQGQARSGLMTAAVPPGQPPQIVHLGPIDQLTAFTASYAVLGALVARERHGFGQEVHVSLLGSAVSMLHFNVLVAQLMGREPPNHDRSAPADPLRNYYRCEDGKWLMLTHVPSQKHWPTFCRAIDVAELIDDPRFHNEVARSENTRELVALLDRVFASRPRDQWLQVGREVDLIFGPVNAVADLASDPQLLANGYLADLDFPGLGPVKVSGFPVQFSKTPAGPRSVAPELGEHNDEVLGEMLGLSGSELEDLRRREII